MGNHSQILNTKNTPRVYGRKCCPDTHAKTRNDADLVISEGRNLFPLTVAEYANDDDEDYDD